MEQKMIRGLSVYRKTLQMVLLMRCILHFSLSTLRITAISLLCTIYTKTGHSV